MKSLTIFFTFNVLLMFAWATPSEDNSPHPYHVSYTEVNTTDTSITIALEVFTDDLELAVKQTFTPEKYFLGADTLSAEGLKLTQAYMDQVFQIVVNGKPLTHVIFFDVASNPDRTTLFLELKNDVAISSLAIKNTVLVNLFADQENIIETKHKGTTQKALLHKGKEVATFTY